MKKVNFSLSSKICVFNCLSSVILQFAFMMKTYCLFIRAFILINCDKHEDIESTYMMMITEAEFPIKGLTLKACFAENQRVR